MDKKEIIAFFDNLAPCWDKTNVRDEDVISEILQKGGIRKGAKVLDVACGTGVLFSDYESLGAEFVAVDISENMVKKAKEKFPEAEVICGDATTYDFGNDFDAVMIYNAFPHFDEPQRLIENLAKSLKKSGRLSVAHGISEKELEKHFNTVTEHKE